MIEALFCTMRIMLLCTGMALKGAILSVAGKGKILWEWNGVGALAYDKDLDGNMY